MARFYVLLTVSTLFGEIALIRNWGRNGTPGQMLLDTFTNSVEALAALSRLHDRKSRRGYRSVAG